MLSNDKKFVKKHSNKKTINKNFQKKKRKKELITTNVPIALSWTSIDILAPILNFAEREEAE